VDVQAPTRPVGLREALGVDPEARARLRRMKRTATGALVLAAATYVVTVLAGADDGLLGFVQAAAEAAMVGGLADWFAVTALFRHPLGIPVPHTALIPRKTDELATKLGEFVHGHSLTGDAVVRELAEARLVHRLATRLADEQTPRQLSERLTCTLADGLDGLDALDERSVSATVLDLSAATSPAAPAPRCSAASSPVRSRARGTRRSSTCWSRGSASSSSATGQLSTRSCARSSRSTTTSCGCSRPTSGWPS
jgi:hypothetical protein